MSIHSTKVLRDIWGSHDTLIYFDLSTSLLGGGASQDKIM